MYVRGVGWWEVKGRERVGNYFLGARKRLEEGKGKVEVEREAI